MKKLFEEPKMDVEVFSVEDVITASSGDISPASEEDETAVVKFNH